MRTTCFWGILLGICAGSQIWATDDHGLGQRESRLSEHHYAHIAACAVPILRRAWRRERQGLIHSNLLANLPEALPMGTVAVHRYAHTYEPKYYDSVPKYAKSPLTLTSLVPLPNRRRHARLVNLNALRYEDPLPRRFVIGDGTLNRVLVGVDLTPGSPLSRILSQIKHQILLRLYNPKEVLPEPLLSLVKKDVVDLMTGVKNDDGKGGRQLPWDKLLPQYTWPLIDLTSVPLDDGPVPIGVDLPVVPLEAYLEAGEGYCLQQMILASLILRMFNVPHRLVAGANAVGIGRTSGHIWIQLRDGRILDTTAWLLEKPKTNPPYPKYLIDSNWKFLEGYKTAVDGEWIPTWRFEYDRYFLLSL